MAKQFLSWTDSKTTATYVLSVALVILALALTYFTFTLAKVAVGLPSLLTQIQETQEKLDPVVVEVRGIKELVPGIVEEVGLIRETIPPILEEVAEVRGALPSILEETARIRETIPPILEEVAEYREQIPAILEQVDGIQAQIPPILEEVEEVRETIPPILDEVEAIRNDVPVILAEVEAVRLAIPEYIVQVDTLVDESIAQIDQASQRAGESVTKGVFTGLIKAPVSIVTNVGENVFTLPEISEEDRAVIAQEVEVLLEDGKRRDRRKWENSRTGMRGEIRVKTVINADPGVCKVLTITVYKGRRRLGTSDSRFCQASDGTWEMVGPEAN